HDRQLDLPAPPAPPRKPPVHLKPPDELAKVVVAKSYKLDASAKLRVPLTLYFSRAVIERLHERAIREGTPLAVMVQGIMERRRGGAGTLPHGTRDPPGLLGACATDEVRSCDRPRCPRKATRQRQRCPQRPIGDRDS